MNSADPKTRPQALENTAPTEDAGLVLSGGTVLNVYSGELLRADVAVTNGRVTAVGTIRGATADDAEVLEVGGKVLVPGYVEPHCHPWLLYNPLTLAEYAAGLGTTTLVCDNLIAYSLLGPERFEEFMAALSRLPVKLFWTCRAGPQTPTEDEAERFSLENVLFFSFLDEL